MQTMRRIRETTSRMLHALALLARGMAGLLPGSGAAAYPEQTITMIVAYAPGGGTDLVARIDK